MILPRAFGRNDDLQGFLASVAGHNHQSDIRRGRNKRPDIDQNNQIDVRTGELRTDQAILIDGNKIAEVGPSSTVGQGGGNTVRVIDLTGLTVLPGLIDCHAHVLGNLKDLSASGPLRMSSPQGALWGVHNLQSCYEVPGAQIFAGALLHILIQCQRCCPEVPAGALDPALAGPTRR